MVGADNEQGLRKMQEDLAQGRIRTKGWCGVEGQRGECRGNVDGQRGECRGNVDGQREEW